jgi:PPOX class probable F420-dependent enzyme
MTAVESPQVPESHHDLLDAQFATFGTVGPDGLPQLSEVWFLSEDGQIKLSFNSSRQKTKNLLKNPAASLFILDLANPYRYLEVRGTAEVERDDDYAFAQRLGAKYGGADVREHDGPDDYRLVVTLIPKRIVAR